MIQIADQCRNRWRSILPMFGINAEFLTGKHGPCPLCDGTDRFRFDDKDGRGTYFCNQCGAGDGIKLLMMKTGETFAEVAQEIRERLGETREVPPAKGISPDEARRRAGGLWSHGVPIFNDEAATYLRGRGLVGPYPTSLRFAASARVSDHPTRQTLPVMLALVVDPDGKPANVHRTYLEGGRKAQIPAPRKMMAGQVPEGSCIRLGTYDGVLGVAEGIETALAVTQQFGLTCWAAIDADKMKKFAIPADVRELHVFGDNDLKFAGQAAAYELARRAATMKDGPQTVTVRIPDQPGADWADPPFLARAA